MSAKLSAIPILAFFSLFLSGCGGHTHDHEPQAGAGEWPARPQTVWTPLHEFFFENEFAVIGQPATFALHVSNLADGSPRTEGGMSMQFQSGDSSFAVNLSAPARPGIYLTEVSFPAAGAWAWSISLDGDTPTLDGVQVFADEAEALAAAAGLEKEQGGITMLKEQQWPARLLVETAQVREMTDRVPATARVTACRTHTARIPSPTTGILLPPPDAGRTTLGQQVTAGDWLAVLRIPLLGDDRASWEASLAQAKHESHRADAELERAVAAFARIEALHAKQAKSSRELEEARYALASARASQQAGRGIWAAWANAKPGSSMDLPLLAPISGQVIHAPTASGEWTAEGDLLFHIQDLGQLHVAVRVPEADLPRLGSDPRARIPHPNGGAELFLPGPDGILLLAGPQVHPVTHSAEVLYEIPNPGWLRSGMTLAAQLSTGAARQALAVSSSAVVDDAGIAVVFVQVSGESFDRRPIRVGIQDGTRTEILEGVAPGEKVVVDGAYLVHLASLSGVIPEHSH